MFKIKTLLPVRLKCINCSLKLKLRIKKYYFKVPIICLKLKLNCQCDSRTPKNIPDRHKCVTVPKLQKSAKSLRPTTEQLGLRMRKHQLITMYVGLGFVSNYFKDKCILIEPDTISWINPWAFFPLLLSSVGIILTLEVRYILGRVDFSV